MVHVVVVQLQMTCINVITYNNYVVTGTKLKTKKGKIWYMRTVYRAHSCNHYLLSMCVQVLFTIDVPSIV